jgi:hypothetical protein
MRTKFRPSDLIPAVSSPNASPTLTMRPASCLLEPALPRHARHADECREQFEAAIAAKSGTSPVGKARQTSRPHAEVHL